MTGIAARTLVVRFTEYGNHEEVLKQDTVPVTKVSKIPLILAWNDLISVHVLHYFSYLT